MSSLTISIEPLAIKYRDTMTSPWCTRVSPGGAWVVLNFIDRALESNNNFDIFHNLPLNVIFFVIITSYRQDIMNIYLRQPEEAPSNAGQLLSKFLFKWTHMSAWRQSGKPFSTIFMSIPFVYVQACWNINDALGISKVSAKHLNKNCVSVIVFKMKW